jgi:hypothetical protein
MHRQYAGQDSNPIGYVQPHSTLTDLNEAVRAARGAPDLYDRVAQLWWNNLDDAVAATSSPEGQAAGLVRTAAQKLGRFPGVSIGLPTL